MLTILMYAAITLVLLAVYSAISHATHYVLGQTDPSTNYSDVSPSPRRNLANESTPMSPREEHDAYLFVASLLWPVTVIVWAVVFMPRSIVLRAARSVDRNPMPPTQGSAYRDKSE